jgi:hypothetical protein
VARLLRRNIHRCCRYTTKFNSGRDIPNPNWDGDWAVQSAITERGWETEMAIPLKTLRYNPGENEIWGFNVKRNIRRKNEQVSRRT